MSIESDSNNKISTSNTQECPDNTTIGFYKTAQVISKKSIPSTKAIANKRTNPIESHAPQASAMILFPANTLK